MYVISHVCGEMYADGLGLVFRVLSHASTYCFESCDTPLATREPVSSLMTRLGPRVLRYPLSARDWVKE